MLFQLIILWAWLLVVEEGGLLLILGTKLSATSLPCLWLGFLRADGTAKDQHGYKILEMGGIPLSIPAYRYTVIEYYRYITHV